MARVNIEKLQARREKSKSDARVEAFWHDIFRDPMSAARLKQHMADAAQATVRIARIKRLRERRALREAV